MTETLKPGTRCGCSDDMGGGKFRFQHRGHTCDGGAVRMVTVPCIIEDADEFGDDLGAKSVPMCEPCAAWHEAKAGRDERGIHCDCGKPKRRDAVACDRCLGISARS